MALKNELYAMLLVFEQYWMAHGSIPTRARIAELGHDPLEYDRALKNREFFEAAEERGIRMSAFGLDGTNNRLASAVVLSELQLACANVMLDLTDRRSDKKKLQDLGVTTAQYNAWRRDPAYSAYIQKRAEDLLGDNVADAHLALVDRVKSGDVNALKFFYELTGRYVPASLKATGNIDIMQLMTAVVEVVQRHVTDLEIQGAIAQDILALATGAGVASGLAELEAAPTVNGVPQIGTSPISNALLAPVGSSGI